MPFNQKPQKFNAKINAVTIGSGDKTVTIGGENVSHFILFDAEIRNAPKSVLKFLIWDLRKYPKVSKLTMKDASTMAEIAKKALLWKVLILLPDSGRRRSERSKQIC